MPTTEAFQAYDAPQPIENVLQGRAQGPYGSSVEIRLLQDSDIPRLAEMEAASFSMPWSAEDFRDLLSHDYCHYLTALVDGVPVGTAGYRESFGEAEIDNVVVDEAYRGQGIGSKLMEELIRYGEAHGIEAFTLEVRAGNASAIALYEKYGFVCEGVRPRFYERPVEDALILWRR